ncbi:MAG: RidA family protein [Pseudomonadota bacterium]
MTGTIDARLAELGLTIPDAPAPAANYVPRVVTGSTLYISGQIPMGPNGIEFVGRLGDTMDAETGAAAARLCAVNLIAQARAQLGDLEHVARVVKLVGFVNSTPDFGDQPKVINGASDLMVAVFGDKGRHARSAVGVAALPFGVAVEVEAIMEIA